MKFNVRITRDTHTNNKASGELEETANINFIL
jgi:hypothetical protein